MPSHPKTEPIVAFAGPLVLSLVNKVWWMIRVDESKACVGDFCKPWTLDYGRRAGVSALYEYYLHPILLLNISIDGMCVTVA